LASILSEEDELLIIESDFVIASKLLEVLILNCGSLFTEPLFKICCNLICKPINVIAKNFNSMEKFLSEFNENVYNGFETFKRNMILCLASIVISNPEKACLFAKKEISWIDTNEKLWQLFEIAAKNSIIEHHLKLFSYAMTQMLSLIDFKNNGQKYASKISQINLKFKEIDENIESDKNVTEELKNIEKEPAEESEENEEEEESECEDYDEEQNLIVTEEVLQNYTSCLEKDTFDINKVLGEQMKMLNILKK